MWDLIAEIHEGSDDVWYPTREQRDGAWERFAALKSEAGRRRDEIRSRRRDHSSEHRKDILRGLRAARLDGLSGSSVDTVKALGAVLREAGQMLSDRKDEMIGEDKEDCYEAILEVREHHDLWWEAY